MLINNLDRENHSLSHEEMQEIANKTEGYSGSDMRQLCTEAAFFSFKEIKDKILDIGASDLRPISVQDFRACLARIKPSVAPEVVAQFLAWNKDFGFNDC